MASRQENNSSYYEMAKEIAKVEKDLGFERWVRIEIAMETTRTEHGTENKRMAFYDLPVWVYQRREWVIRWRAARIQCQHPRNQVRTFSDYYRRMNGNDLGMQQDIDKFISSKAAVTRQRNNLERYLAERRQDMFFDEASDQTLQDVKAKLAEREQQVREAEQRLIQKVKEYKERQEAA